MVGLKASKSGMRQPLVLTRNPEGRLKSVVTCLAERKPYNNNSSCINKGQFEYKEKFMLSAVLILLLLNNDVLHLEQI